MVNELIQARFLGLFSEKAYEFDDLLEKINFEQKVRLLKKWGIINDKLRERIEHIFAVRNQLAHRWDEREAFYEKVSLIENFEKFKADGESVWVHVVQAIAKFTSPLVNSLISLVADVSVFLTI